MKYGQKVLERHQRWCEIALAKENALPAAGRHAE
jgi:hypothetical protein